MANPRIVNYYPPTSSVALPLATQISITFSEVVDAADLVDNLFLEGPDTDQFVGPGLIELTSPDNISQGELDDFLKSPGYTGMVKGTYSPVSGMNTTFKFIPTHPLYPSIEYTAYLLGTYDIERSPGVWETVSGLTWTFQTGTGSIQELPSNLSTSILAELVNNNFLGLAPNPADLKVVRLTPADHSVDIDTHLEEIVITFDKLIDPASVTESSVYVETLPATDHPSAPVFCQGEIMTQLEVSGYQLKIKL